MKEEPPHNWRLAKKRVLCWQTVQCFEIRFFAKRQIVSNHMKTRLRKILIRIHFIALTIAVLNSLFKNFTTYSLEGNIEFGIEILTAISGLTLFFFYLKPFKKINYYFSISATVSFFLIFGLIFRVFILGFVLSILLFPMIPDDKKFEENGIIIATPFQGFITACCSYQIKERQLLIFEKDYGRIITEGPISFETVRIHSTETEIELTYSTGYDNELINKKKINKIRQLTTSEFIQAG